MNPMSFNPSNYSLNIRDFIGILTPKVGMHLGVCGLIPSLSCTPANLDVTFGLHFLPEFFHALVLVMSPRLGS
jgi:hypothetical protein